MNNRTYQSRTVNSHSQTDTQSLFQPPKPRFLFNEQFSSPYYQDFTQEQYAIQRAFETNNFNSIRNLPDQFQHKQILNNRIQRVRNQVEQEKIQRDKPYEQKLIQRSANSKAKKLEKIGTLGFFQLFPYMESQYDLAKQLSYQKYEQSLEQRKKICEIDFRPSDKEKKTKFQDPFKYKDKMDTSFKNNADYLFPFHKEDDDYNQFKQSQTRKRIISEAARLAGPFFPSMKQSTLGTIHKSKIQEILTDLQFCLKKYMNKYGYIIGVNKKDYIQILFQKQHKQDLKLKIFMSGICEHQILTKYKLKRDLQNFGIILNNYISYTLITPWTQKSHFIKSDIN